MLGIVNGISLSDSNKWLHDLKGINYGEYTNEGKFVNNYGGNINLGGNPNVGDEITFIFDLREGQNNLKIIRNGIDVGRVLDYIKNNNSIYLALSLLDTKTKIELKSYI